MLIDDLKLLFRGAWRLLTFVCGRDFRFEEWDEEEGEDQEESTFPKPTAPIAPKGYSHFRG